MILKYKVKDNEMYRYKNKRILYCETLQKQELLGTNGIILYKVKILNLDNRIDLFINTELKKLNFIDKIKLKIGGMK